MLYVNSLDDDPALLDKPYGENYYPDKNLYVPIIILIFIAIILMKMMSDI